jgi:hypothetical protein
MNGFIAFKVVYLFSVPKPYSNLHTATSLEKVISTQLEYIELEALDLLE